jgi:hemerythrin-like metal-binding protein
MSIEWDDSFSVGHSKIDSQHKKIIELINYADECIKLKNGDYENANTALNNMFDYLDIHFKTEEELMGISNYPEFVKHKSLHFEFVKKWSELNKKIIKENSFEFMSELSGFLKDWLIKHILITDKKFGEFLIHSSKQQ